MALSIPKISLGSSTERNTFDLSHDFNGTADFGFCMPTLFHEVIPQTKVHLKTNALVRLAPLPTPSFARVQLKTFNNFVPTKDVFPAFDYMMAQQTVQSAYASYVPQKVDYVTQQQLIRGLFAYDMTVNVGRNKRLLAIPVCYKIYKSGTHDDPYEVWGGSALTSHFDTIRSNFLAYSSDVVSASNIVEKNSKTVLANDVLTDLLDFGLSVRHFSRGDYPTVSQLSLYNDIKKYIYVSPTPENADFMFLVESGSDYDFYLAFHLTHEGKRVFKVFQAIGYQFRDNDNVSILPLLAYYKTWFDTFNPHRKVQWKATKAYKLIHGYYDTGFVMKDYISNPEEAEYYNGFDVFFSFLYDFQFCCYTLDIDPVTVCLESPVQGNSFYNDFTQFTGIEDTESTFISKSDYPSVSSPDNSVMMRWMQKLLPFVNKNSVIGARVDKFMKVHFGTSLPESYQFGNDTINLNIEDIFATADTSSAYLGEYAGRGKGYGSSKNNSFEANEHGYIFQIACIVPFGGYSQSLNPLLCNLDNTSVYMSEFDGLGMDVVRRSEVFGSASLLSGTVSPSSSFGFRPRKMEYKFKHNVRVGGFANRSERQQFLPYQLDRIFTEKDLSLLKFKDGSERFSVEDNVEVRCDESLRYIGTTEDYGNYDRIFIDNTGVTDNFIIHMIQDFQITSPMLPVAESFDTYDGSGLKDDDNNMRIQHA